MVTLSAFMEIEIVFHHDHMITKGKCVGSKLSRQVYRQDQMTNNGNPHFINNCKSNNPYNPAYVPTIFSQYSNKVKPIYQTVMSAVVQTNKLENCISGTVDTGLTDPLQESNSDSISDPHHHQNYENYPLVQLRCKGDAEAYSCKYCNFKTHFKIALFLHIQKSHIASHNHESKIHKMICYSCKFCTFESFSILLFLKHENHNQRNIKTCLYKSHHCIYCSFVNATNTGLKKHIYHKHTAFEEIHWYKCDHCDYKTKIKRDLRNHVYNMHTVSEDIRWFKCDLCDYKAKFKTKLKSHFKYKHLAPTTTKTNSNVIKFHLCDRCNYKSNYISNLQRHIKARHAIEVEIKWFKCDFCDYKAKYKSSLARHVEVQHDSREPVTCSFCNYKTNDKIYMERHIYTYHSASIQWYTCDPC